MENNIPSFQSDCEPALIEHFWRISTDFYSNDLVCQHLLMLQNRENKNINQLLFVLWVSAYYHVVLDDSFYQLACKDGEKPELWVKAIRKVRYELLQSEENLYSAKLANLKKSLLSAELGIEKIHQQSLVKCVLEWFEQNKQATKVDLTTLILSNLNCLCGDSKNPELYKLLVDFWLEYYNQ